MDIRFKTYNDFLAGYQIYNLDKCNKCKGVRELRYTFTDGEIRITEGAGT